MTLKRKMGYNKGGKSNIQKITSRTITSNSECEDISNNIEQKKPRKFANTNHKNSPIFVTKSSESFTATNSNIEVEELPQKKIKKSKELDGSSPASKSDCGIIIKINKKKPGNLASINHKNSSGANNWTTFMASGRPTKSVEKLSQNKTSKPLQIGLVCSPTVVSKRKLEVGLSEIIAKKPGKFVNINHKNKVTGTYRANIEKKMKASNSKKVCEMSHKESSEPQDLVGHKSTLLNLAIKSKNKSHILTGVGLDRQNKQTRGLPREQGEPQLRLKATTYCQPLRDVGIPKLKSSINNELSTHKCIDYKERSLTKQIAMDCEMVGVEIGANKSMVARVSLVNALGDCIYDKYVKPTEPILCYRTNVSGIRPKDLENSIDFKTVQKEVADILKGRVLVGHALKNDLSVLFLTHPKRAIRDTSKFHKFREGRTPALKKLAKKYLGVTIQEGEHSSVQDALAAMQLYRMFRKEWEASLWSKKTGKPNIKDVRKKTLSQIKSEV